MIITLALPIIEKVINRALRADPNALKKLTAIKDQTIAVDCTDYQIQFNLIVTDQGVQLEKQAPKDPDTMLSSTLSSFLQLLSKGSGSTALFKHPVSINGNTHNLEVLRDTFKNLDIDWEEILSRYLGDAIAHKLCFRGKRASQAASNAKRKLAENTLEYLHFEAKALPTKSQVELFYDDIAQLKNDVERMEARIQLLANTKASDHV